MKNTITALLVFAVFILLGCTPEKTTAPLTAFPTNTWNVVSVADGMVVVETKGTNLLERYRVVKATPVVPMTNGQPVRVEFAFKRKLNSQVEITATKAYPVAQ
jgi:hypothetical protein